jgi:hypothetical protein
MRLVSMILLALLFADCSHRPASNNINLQEIANVADKINEDAMSLPLRVQRAKTYIDQNFDRLSKQETDDWMENRIHFDSLKRINFYLHEDRLNLVLEKLYWKLRLTGFAKEQDAKDLYESFLVHRQLDEAVAFFKKLPDFLTNEYIPVTKIGRRPADMTGPLLLLSSYTGVVIIGSPSCQFTRVALVDLLKTQKAKFFKNAVVVVPQELVEFEVLKKWNTAHPSLPYKVAYRQQEFKPLEFGTLPTFYFLKNGSVAYTFEGWSLKDNSLAKIEEGLSKI